MVEPHLFLPEDEAEAASSAFPRVGAHTDPASMRQPPSSSATNNPSASLGSAIQQQQQQQQQQLQQQLQQATFGGGSMQGLQPSLATMQQSWQNRLQQQQQQQQQDGSGGVENDSPARFFPPAMPQHHQQPQQQQQQQQQQAGFPQQQQLGGGGGGGGAMSMMNLPFGFQRQQFAQQLQQQELQRHQQELQRHQQQQQQQQNQQHPLGGGGGGGGGGFYNPNALYGSQAAAMGAAGGFAGFESADSFLATMGAANNNNPLQAAVAAATAAQGGGSSSNNNNINNASETGGGGGTASTNTNNMFQQARRPSLTGNMGQPLAYGGTMPEQQQQQHSLQQLTGQQVPTTNPGMGVGHQAGLLGHHGTANVYAASHDHQNPASSGFGAWPKNQAAWPSSSLGTVAHLGGQMAGMGMTAGLDMYGSSGSQLDPTLGSLMLQPGFLQQTQQPLGQQQQQQQQQQTQPLGQQQQQQHTQLGQQHAAMLARLQSQHHPSFGQQQQGLGNAAQPFQSAPLHHAATQSALESSQMFDPTPPAAHRPPHAPRNRRSRSSSLSSTASLSPGGETGGGGGGTGSTGVPMIVGGEGISRPSGMEHNHPFGQQQQQHSQIQASSLQQQQGLFGVASLPGGAGGGTGTGGLPDSFSMLPHYMQPSVPMDAEQSVKRKGGPKNKRAKTFPEKLMEAMMDHAKDDAVAWLPDGKSFVIVSPDLFVKDVLNRVFKEAKYASFIRKLHRWGFVRLTSGTGTDCFHHPLFQRGRKDLASKISCSNTREKDGGRREGRSEKPPSLAGVEKFIRAKAAADAAAAKGKLSSTVANEGDEEDDDDNEHHHDDMVGNMLAADFRAGGGEQRATAPSTQKAKASATASGDADTGGESEELFNDQGGKMYNL